MTFEDFCRSYGLILDHALLGKWVATPTTDHPRKRNGRYKLLGDIGWVQNWATMSEPVTWKSSGAVRSGDVSRQLRDAQRERAQAAQQAANRAQMIMSQAQTQKHPYLERKGFPDLMFPVWEGKLVVPMRINGTVVGAQLIDEQGEKKFLPGQTSKGASFTFDAGGLPFFCEGFATALSLRAALQAMKMRHRIVVAFSAGNLEHIAGQVARGFIIADHDANGVGENAARKTGHPYWISPAVGEDFNDFHVRLGSFRASQELKHFVLRAGESSPKTEPRSA